MRMAKSLSLTGVVLAIVALFGATIALAQVPTSCATPNFRVNVAMENIDGITSYIYTMSNAPGSSKNANKFFVYSRPGLEGDLLGTIAGSLSGEYASNGESPAANCPPSSYWTVNTISEGWCFTSVAMQNQPTLTVSERYQPEEGATTVLLTYGSTTESCGPILGPMTDGPPSDPGDPVASKTMSMESEACTLKVTAANKTNKRITKVEVDDSKPNPGNCQVTFDPEACKRHGIEFCTPLELGDSPLTFVSQEGSGASITSTCAANTGASPAGLVCHKETWLNGYLNHSCNYPVKINGVYQKTSTGLWKCS